MPFPPNATLLSLGAHRLKDLGRTETVFQLLHPSLPAEFPPLNSLDNPALPNNLPQQTTSFIGREKQVEEVKTLLEKTRLLTLTGSGGGGKTRLGLQVAADVLEHYPDGAWLVELAPLADPALVTQAVAQVLGVREEAGKPLAQTLVDFLKAKHLLLVLDNCEHVLDACSRLVDTLIRSCPNVQVLASSREGLGIAGELTYRIPSLSLPDPKQAVTVDNVGQYEAVQLFIERALFHLPTFAVTHANAPALASVCQRLDGIPLALELSAARIRSLSIEEINSKLDNRFRLLTGGSRTALPRQQTLRALIDWSYDLLNAQEKALLCRLCVFAGGWTLEAAEAVAVGEDIEDWEMLDFLTSLTDKSLVVAEAEQGQTRYRLLETVRQYARDRLLEDGGGATVHDRHLEWFLRLAEEVKPNLFGPEQARWFELLETEHDNFRAALEWCRAGGAGQPGPGERTEDLDTAEMQVRLTVALSRFWGTRGYLREGQAWLREAMSRLSPATPPLRRNAVLFSVAWYALRSRDFVSARLYYGQSLDILREQAHKLGERPRLGSTLNHLAGVAQAEGHYEEARTLYGNAIADFREQGDEEAVGMVLQNLGELALMNQDYEAARVHLEESLPLLAEHARGHMRLNLGLVALRQGRHAEALAEGRESLRSMYRAGHMLDITKPVFLLALLAARNGQPERAVRLFGASEGLRRSIGLPSAEYSGADSQVIATVRVALGEPGYAAAVAAGRAMTLEQVVEYALSDG